MKVNGNSLNLVGCLRGLRLTLAAIVFMATGLGLAPAQTTGTVGAALIEANGFDMVRLEALAAWSGATFTFDPDTKKIDLWLDRVHVELLANSISARSGTTRLRLPTPAIVRNGSAYLPLQWAGQALGVEISLNLRAREVTVLNPRTRTSRDTPIGGTQYRYTPEVIQWVPYVPSPRSTSRARSGPVSRAGRLLPSRGETPYTNALSITNQRSDTLHVTYENEDYTRQVRVAGGSTVTIGMPDGRFKVSCWWDSEPDAIYDSEPVRLNGSDYTMTFGVSQGNRSLKRRR